MIRRRVGHGAPARLGWRRVAAGGRRRWPVPSPRRAAAAIALIASTIVAGPADSTAADAPGLGALTTDESAHPYRAEQALTARLAAGYAGAVPAADVEALLLAVSVRLRAEPRTAEAHLLDTAEAVSRRALTDFLTRGTPLPLE